MSESDSIPATNSNSSADNKSVNPAPYMKKKPDDSNESTHGYFIPVVLVLVLGVIIIATFYSKEFNSLVASMIPADEGAQLTASVKEKFYAKSNMVQDSENTTTITGTEKSSETSAYTVNVSDSAQSATTSSGSAGTAATEQVTEDDSPAAPDRLAAIQNQPTYPVYMNRYPNPLPYAPPSAAYAMPGEWNAYNELMEQRRQAYEEVQREHQKRMLEYRAAVMKRIEQDRQEMLRHMQELAQQSQRRRDEYMNRLEQFEKTSMDHPI